MRKTGPHIAPLARGLLLFWCACFSGSAVGDLNDCDWSVAEMVASREGQTKQEIEDELVRQLAIKLAQFDQCLERDSPSSVSRNEVPPGDTDSRNQVAQQAEGRERPREEGEQPPAQAGVSAPVGGSPTGSSKGGANPGRTDTATAANRQGLDEPFDQPAQRGTRTPAGGTADSAAQNGVALPGERERVRANVVEDDVARILREAAEQEPDPTRKAALWEEYDKYVKNL